MASFYINKHDIKNNDGYIIGQRWHESCLNCSYNGETPVDCYVCAKNPYKLASVSHLGHCNCFTKDSIEFTKVQKLLLKLKCVNFRYNERIK